MIRDAGQTLGEVLRCIGSVDSGHAHIEQDNIGPVLHGELDRLMPVRSFGNHLKLCFALQQETDAAANERVIVCNQNARSRRWHAAFVPCGATSLRRENSEIPVATVFQSSPPNEMIGGRDANQLDCVPGSVFDAGLGWR